MTVRDGPESAADFAGYAGDSEVQSANAAQMIASGGSEDASNQFFGETRPLVPNVAIPVKSPVYL
jgi:hypothetical protein